MDNEITKKPAQTENGDALAKVPTAEIEELPEGALDDIAGGVTIGPVEIGGEIHAKLQ